MTKSKTAVKVEGKKHKDKEKECSLEEVAMDEVTNKEGGPIVTKRKKKKKEVVGEENEKRHIVKGESKMEMGQNKKKKKKKGSSDITVCDDDILEKEQHVVKKLEKKVDINSEDDVPLGHKGGKKNKTGELSSEKDCMEKTKKKKKGKKGKADESNGDNRESGAEDTDEKIADMEGGASVEREAKKRKRKEAAYSEKTYMELEDSTQEKKEKRKKKKPDSIEKDVTSNIKQTENKKGKKKKTGCYYSKDTANTDTGSDLEIIEEKTVDSMTKKGKKKTNISVNTETPELKSHAHGEEKKQKKKKGVCKDEHAQQLLVKELDEGEASETAVVNGKKRKKSKKDLTETSIVETPTPKKKKKLPEESTPAKEIKKENDIRAEPPMEVTEVVFLSERPGNKDEILIDQERRLALQRDIDKESQPKPALGQWGTAQFDSSDQQQKFLRLMGGFKKGNQLGTSSVGAQPNMALGKEGQQSLQQKLLGQFECAQNRRKDFTNRGAGLGFSAPSTNKFSIDVNASRSMKFDD